MRSSKRPRSGRSFVAILLVSGALLGMPPTAVLSQPAPKPAVTVMVAENRPIVPGLTFTGRAVAVEKVDIRARVSGYLEEQRFKDGQDVKTGDLMFVIEPDLFQAEVDQKKANLVAAQAKAENAGVQLARARELLPRQTVSQAVFEDRQAEKRIADAEVLQAQASLKQAEINLGYTQMKAPITGRAGQAAFRKGALVGPESGALATVVSRDPIYVTFPVSQRQILEVRERLNRTTEEIGKRAVVRLQLSDNALYPSPGKIDFADVTVDRSTDTLIIRAIFPNQNGLLVDGQFVRVRVEDSEPVMAIMVPQRAILNDQAGSYVFVVGPDNKVAPKRVTLGPAQGSEVVVQAGLALGDKVITDGIQKVRAGVEVDAVVAPPPSSLSKG